MESNNIELITRMVIQAINQNEKKGDGFMVPIGVSARHIHLTQEHVEALFGPGYQLTKKKELMGGQFASNETVTIVGLKLRAIENVRILGPVRKASQVEVSATDAIKLGMNVPVRESGDVAGSAPIAIVGPKGAVYLKEGCIVAMRHIHMSPKDAQAAGVKDGDIVSVKADNERGTIFNQVKIRVDDSFTPVSYTHLDVYKRQSMACAKWETIETILPYLDTYLMDIKHTNPAKHKEFTGRSNELMMENARKVALSGKTRLVIRVPVIPTFNDTVEEIQGIARFADTLPGVDKIHLLPYHRLGQDKYEGLGRPYLMGNVEPPSKEHMETLKKAVHAVCGLDCQIGG